MWKTQAFQPSTFYFSHTCTFKPSTSSMVSKSAALLTSHSVYFWRTVRSTARSLDSDTQFQYSASLEPTDRKLGMPVAKKQESVALSNAWKRLQPSLRGQANLATKPNKIINKSKRNEGCSERFLLILTIQFSHLGKYEIR